MVVRRFVGFVLLLALVGCASVPVRAPLPVAGDDGAAEPGTSPVAGRAPVDLVVFAPHPDDETLGAAGVMMQALGRGERVHVVIFTNGDGYPDAASLLLNKPVDALRPDDYLELARVRQLEVHGALAVLGLTPADVTFLGYPDAGLDKVYETRGEELFVQRFTGKSETYGIGAPDFHTKMHGSGAPYRYESVLDDLVRLLSQLQPKEIYVTHERDNHPDHQAAHRFVKDALRAIGFTGAAYTYLIHDGPGWPWPEGPTPTAHHAPEPVNGEQVPRGAPWPPPVRGALTEQEALRKLTAIRAYPSQLAAARTYLESYAKAEEIFWYLGAP